MIRELQRKVDGAAIAVKEALSLSVGRAPRRHAQAFAGTSTLGSVQASAVEMLRQGRADGRSDDA